MEVIAEKKSVCPYCGWDVESGDTIRPYAGIWYHSQCWHELDFPAIGTSEVSAEKQKRAERIKKYRLRYPEYSVRDLAEYLGYSKSTVARVLQQQARLSRQAASAALRARANLSSTGRGESTSSTGIA